MTNELFWISILIGGMSYLIVKQKSQRGMLKQILQNTEAIMATQA